MQLVRLKTRREFVAVREHGDKVVRPAFVLQYAPLARVDARSDPDACAQGCRVGFTATRKLGHAVRRNRVKRRLRAMVAQVFPREARPGYAYVLIGRNRTADIAFEELCRQGRAALKRAHGSASGAEGKP